MRGLEMQINIMEVGMVSRKCTLALLALLPYSAYELAAIWLLCLGG